MASVKNRRRTQRGAELIEAALMLPILMLLTFGAIEYGWMLMEQSELTGGAQTAARLAVLPTSTNATVLADISTVMTADGLANSGYTTTLTPANIAQATSGQTVTVYITVPYQSLLSMPLIPVPKSLSASVTMAKEGP